jgi:hypothetical protein
MLGFEAQQLDFSLHAEKVFCKVRYEVLMAAGMMVAVFWVVALCGLVEV